jgi:hypothetical protein
MQVVVENSSWATALNVLASWWLFTCNRANPNSNTAIEHSVSLSNLTDD